MDTPRARAVDWRKQACALGLGLVYIAPVQLRWDRPAVRLAFVIGVLLTLTVLGTVGYVVIEDASVLDALYMTVITLSTVGFGEIVKLSTAGRIFTILLILSGVGTVAYLFTTMVQLLAVDVLSRFSSGISMQDQIDQLENHVIVCGFGRLGQIVVEEIVSHKVKVVVIERDPLKEPELRESGQPYLLGNASADDMLARAGLARARAIVAGTNSDPDNVFITLAAREKRRDLQIHARGESTESIRRLKQAGADYVISAYQMGGLRIAASVLRPSVAQFLEIARPRFGHAVDLEEIRVVAGGTLVGKSIVEVEHQARKLKVVALLRSERIELGPDEDLKIEADDRLVVIGERSGLERLASMAAPPR